MTEVVEAETQTQSIAVIVESNPAVVLLDAKSKDDLFNHIRSEIAAFEPDTSTAKGRAAIKSFAFKIVQTKTAVDDAGKKLTEEWRQKTNAVNESRREVKQELTDLAVSVRKPLTDWEEAEKKRIEECNEVIQWMKSAKNVFIEDTSEDVRARGAKVYETEITAEKYGDLFAEAEAVKAETIESLKTSLARLTREEADRAELARLKQAEEERLAREAEEREAEERRKQEEEAAKREEENRIAAEQAEQERIAKAEQEAADKARREAEEEAEQARAAEQKRIDDENAEKERKHQEELAAERKRAEDLERENAEREAEERRVREETERRQKDVEHRTLIKSQVKAGLIAAGVNEKTAVKVVLAILAGDIPNLKMEF